MTKLKERIAALVNSRAIQEKLRKKAVRRMKARHAGQVQAERRARAAQGRADVFTAQGDTKRADREAKRAGKEEVKAEREFTRAVAYKQVARRKTQLIEKIDTTRAAAEKRLAEMKPRVGKAGKVVGAKSDEEAADFVATRAWKECAEGKRPNFYSMYNPGFNCKHALEPNRSTGKTGQLYGERSDCSLFTTEVAYAAGLPDPNGTDWSAGYTGTQVGGHNGWHEVSRAEMERRGFGYVIYGPGTGHHVEWFVGNGMTIGHGTAAIDPGTVDLFGDGSYRCFVLN